MAELAVFGSGNPADVEEYFQAGADRFFIALSGDLKRELHALRAAGRLQDDGRVGVAQLEWVDGATLVESLPRDWRVPCVMSKFFVPHDAGCDVMTIPAAWTEPGDFPEKDVVRALKERICHRWTKPTYVAWLALVRYPSAEVSRPETSHGWPLSCQPIRLDCFGFARMLLPPAKNSFRRTFQRPRRISWRC